MLNKNIRDYLALWAIPGMGSINSRKIIAYAQGIENVFKLTRKDLLSIPGFGEHMAGLFKGSKHFEAADKELEFIERYNINVYTYFDDTYPYRLKQIEDAPLVLFSKGQTINNEYKFLSVVGTRQATHYGIDFCNRLIKEIKNNGHKLVVVSGLAFGVDIAAHKAALDNEMPTIGVLAHGLDQLYPATHKNTAKKMLEQGALVSDFMSGIFPDKNNFLRRNRIIAGLSDATLVVESNISGGSLITAHLAHSYNRDVFAVPGRINDTYSSGCHKIIKSNIAALIESASDLEYAMGWTKTNEPIQKQLFIELTPEEQQIMNVFNNSRELNIDTICRNSKLSMAKVSALLLQLEFAGLVKCLPGKIFIKT